MSVERAASRARRALLVCMLLLPCADPRAGEAPATESPPGRLTLTTVAAWVAAHDPLLAAERLELDASGDMRWAARAGWLPSLTISAGKGRERRRSNLPESDYSFGSGGVAERYSTHSYSATLSQRLFDGFRTLAQMDLARAEEMQQRAQLDNALNERLFRAVTSMFEYEASLRRLRIAETAHKELARLCEIVTARVGAGQLALVDRVRIESRLMEMERVLLERRAGLDTAALHFEAATGIKLMGRELVASPMPPSFDRKALDSLVAEVMGHPALRRAHAQSEAREAERRVQRATLLPEVSLDISRTDSRNLGGTVDQPRTTSAMVYMRWNLFSGFGDTARLLASKAREMAAVEREADVHRRLEEEARNMRTSYEKARDALVSGQRSLTAAEQMRMLVRRQFETGLRQPVDLADVVLEEHRVALSLVALEQEVRVAYHALLALAGHLPAHLGVPAKDRGEIESLENG